MKQIHFDDIKEGDVILEYNPRTSFIHRKSIFVMQCKDVNSFRNISGKILRFMTKSQHRFLDEVDLKDGWISNNPNLVHFKLNDDEINLMAVDIL